MLTELKPETITHIEKAKRFVVLQGQLKKGRTGYNPDDWVTKILNSFHTLGAAIEFGKLLPQGWGTPWKIYDRLLKKDVHKEHHNLN